MASTHSVVQRIRVCTIASILSLATSSAFASGFALIEQSVSSMGNAYAGAGSVSEDTSTIYFNPASMSAMEGRQVTSGLHVILPNSEFEGDGVFNPSHPAFNAPSPLAPLAGTTVGGGDGGDGGVDAGVPHFAYVQDINEKMKFGLTVNAPFGLSTEYDSDWVGRYSAIESEIFTLNFNPSISYKLDEHTSFGFGVSAMYANLKLENAIDFALLDLLGAIPGGPFFGGAPPASLDGNAQLDVDDVGYGYNFGVMLQPTDSTRLGLAYRSKVKLELEGDVEVKHSLLPNSKQDADVDVDLPDTLTLSAFHEVNSQWAIMGDIIWTHWSRIDALVADLENGTSNVIPLEWDDTYRVAVGASYKYDDAWTLRTGVAFDETPVPSAEFRPAALPDEDRVWLTFGAGYKHSDQLTFDFAYAHLFIDDTKIRSSDSFNTASGVSTGFHQIDGTFEADVDILSAQVNWKF